MNRYRLAALLLPLLLAAPAHAADADKGKELHDKNCLKCHRSEVYTRADHRVTSRAGLDKQVQRCELNLGLRWFDDDIANVAAYLNRDYYHFQ